MSAVQSIPEVDRLIDGDTYQVEVMFDAHDLVPRLLKALGSSGHLIAQQARFRRAADAQTRAQALVQVERNPDVENACSVRMSPETALLVGHALLAFAAEPDRCRAGCSGSNYATRGDGLCDGCGNEADVREADYSHIKAVS